MKQLGRRRWKKVSGYHRQGGVENAFFRYKSIIGDGLRARSPGRQGSEVVLGCEILNRMTEFSRPVPISYRPVRILSMGIVRARDDSCNNATRASRVPLAEMREPRVGTDGPGALLAAAVRGHVELLAHRRESVAEGPNARDVPRVVRRADVLECRGSAPRRRVDRARPAGNDLRGDLDRRRPNIRIGRRYYSRR